MSTDHQEPVTRMLQAAAAGDQTASADLLPLVYDELRALAKARLKREAPGQTLQPTALVHEAYLRLVGNADPGWEGRGHFFASAARAMRRILVDRAREKMARKRGGDWRRAAVEGDDVPIEPPSDEVLAVDEAIKRLEQEDPRKGQIVNLRYFAMMSTTETAAALGISAETVRREWRYIRTWLECELRGESEL